MELWLHPLDLLFCIVFLLVPSWQLLRGSPFSLPLPQLQILHTPPLTVPEVLCDELLHVDL